MDIKLTQSVKKGTAPEKIGNATKLTTDKFTGSVQVPKW